MRGAKAGGSPPCIYTLDHYVDAYSTTVHARGNVLTRYTYVCHCV